MYSVARIRREIIEKSPIQIARDWRGNEHH